MKFLQKSLKEFALETINGVKDSRKVLVTRNDTKNLDAITQAFLKPGQCWDWHLHENIDEVAIVLKGKGKVGYNGKEKIYSENDIILIPTNSMHKWEAIESSEFFFIRINVE